MGKGGFQLTKDAFKKQEPVFLTNLNEATMETEQFLNDRRAMMENVLNTTDHRALDKRAAASQMEAVDMLLSDTQTTKELNVSEEQLSRLHSIKARMVVDKLLKQGGSDSNEMKTIKETLISLENLMVSVADQKMT
ncbi:MAG: hypothetical protein IJ589_11745, partial [Lachnospiraceae bacterium]|nr:hypothetical protein [Lachnospiraceae bacterium]